MRANWLEAKSLVSGHLSESSLEPLFFVAFEMRNDSAAGKIKYLSNFALVDLLLFVKAIAISNSTLKLLEY